MEISVIIPTHRPKDYLWECLDSLTRQTLPKEKFEMIIILNGIKESYYSEIEDYIQRNCSDSNVRLIYTETAGVSNARNIGLDNAQGKFIAFIDDDDKLSPTYLEELYAKADEQTMVIANTYNYFEDAPDKLIPVRPTELHGILSPKGRTNHIEARRFFFSACMKLIPMAMIGNRRFDTRLTIGEDCIFMFLISDKTQYVDFTSSEAIYYRRLRGDSALGTQKKGGRWKIFLNDIRMIAAYTRIYLSGLRRYSLFFYLTRVRGAIHI